MINHDCLFCRMVLGKEPYHKIYEDDKNLGFLDIYPNTKGQSLVIPKKHFGSNIFDMPQEDYISLFLAVKETADKLTKSLGSQRVFIVFEGMEIDHAHIKLYPMYDESYLGYLTTEKGPNNIGIRADEEELKELARIINKY